LVPKIDTPKLKFRVWYGSNFDFSINQAFPAEISNADLSIVGRWARGTEFKIQVAEYCVEFLTSCERINLAVEQEFEQRGLANVYFRLNVPQSIGNIGLDEWDKIEIMTALTQNYTERANITRSIQLPRF
jgi:hypothetical protein